MKTFQQFLKDDISDLSTLKLVHTTSGYRFREILRHKEINLSHCDVLDEELIFTYYGKPEYRLKSNDENVNDTSYPLVTIVLKNDAFKNCYKVFPFDTGAFVKVSGFKTLYFNEEIEISDFELAGSIDSAKKVVKTFYETNENYIELETLIKSPFENLDFEVDGYIKLINDRGNHKWDHRVKTIEVVHNKIIKLDDKTIEQIILPSCYYDDDDVREIINNEFKISNPLTYKLSGGDPNQYWSQINNLFKEYC